MTREQGCERCGAWRDVDCACAPEPRPHLDPLPRCLRSPIPGGSGPDESAEVPPQSPPSDL